MYCMGISFFDVLLSMKKFFGSYIKKQKKYDTTRHHCII